MTTAEQYIKMNLAWLPLDLVPGGQAVRFIECLKEIINEARMECIHEVANEATRMYNSSSFDKQKLLELKDQIR